MSSSDPNRDVTPPKGKPLAGREILSLGQGIEQLREILSKMSNADALVAYKMIGAEQNLTVRSVFAPTMVAKGNPMVVQSSSPGNQKRGPNRGVQRIADPEVSVLRRRIDEKNKEISSESQKLGGKRLDESHRLIIERAQLFRDLKNLKVAKTSA
jgi:hypothetical protein